MLLNLLQVAFLLIFFLKFILFFFQYLFDSSKNVYNSFYIRVKHFQVWLKSESLFFTEAEFIFYKNFNNYSFYFFLFSITNRLFLFLLTYFLFNFFFIEVFQPEYTIINYSSLKDFFLAPLVLFFYRIEFIFHYVYFLISVVIDYKLNNINTSSIFYEMLCFLYSLFEFYFL